MKYFKHLSFIFIVAILFTACSQKELSPISTPKVSDIKELSQTANDDFINQEKATKDYFDKFFKPWSASKVSYPKIEAMWGNSYR